MDHIIGRCVWGGHAVAIKSHVWPIHRPPSLWAHAILADPHCSFARHAVRRAYARQGSSLRDHQQGACHVMRACRVYVLCSFPVNPRVQPCHQPSSATVPSTLESPRPPPIPSDRQEDSGMEIASLLHRPTFCSPEDLYARPSSSCQASNSACAVALGEASPTPRGTRSAATSATLASCGVVVVGLPLHRRLCTRWKPKLEPCTMFPNSMEMCGRRVEHTRTLHGNQSWPCLQPKLADEENLVAPQAP